MPWHNLVLGQWTWCGADGGNVIVTTTGESVTYRWWWRWPQQRTRWWWTIVINIVFFILFLDNFWCGYSCWCWLLKRLLHHRHRHGRFIRLLDTASQFRCWSSAGRWIDCSKWWQGGVWEWLGSLCCHLMASSSLPSILKCIYPFTHGGNIPRHWPSGRWVGCPFGGDGSSKWCGGETDMAMLLSLSLSSRYIHPSGN